MNCPNCQTPYEGDVRFCPICGHPLSNAQYTQLSEARDAGRPARGRPGRILMVIILVLLLLAIAAPIGYQIYIKGIESSCRKATDQIFSMAHDMDFSSIPASELPDELKDNPDIREWIREAISEIAADEGGNNQLAETISEFLDADSICDDIVSSASYEILSVDADYHSCRVTVRTENTDYSLIAGEIYDALYEELTDSDNLWQTIGSFFSSLIGEEDEDDSEDIDIPERIMEIYQKAKENTPKVTETGVIEYGIRDGSWTVTNADTRLFTSYYGVSTLLDKSNYSAVSLIYCETTAGYTESAMPHRYSKTCGHRCSVTCQSMQQKGPRDLSVVVQGC